MLQEICDFKQNFFAQLEERNIPTHNRAVCFYYLSLEVEKYPNDEALRQLLITAICDTEFLLYHFLPKQSEEELLNNYRTTRLKSNKLHKLLEENNILREQWLQIKKRKTLPSIEKFISSKYNAIQNETTMLYQLYFQYFETSEKKATELRNNLEHFVSLSHSHTDYHQIAPFFFYQIMVKHTKRLATNVSFQFLPKSLWEYKAYAITRNNRKNYDTYQKNILLFLDLCNYYELSFDVNIELCKYAFSQTCNLMEWIELYDKEIAMNCQTPLLRFYEELALSHIEPCEPNEYDGYSIYDISFDTEIHYNEIYENEYIEIENTISQFLLDHAEYLVLFMEELHKDRGAIKDMILTVYQGANLEILYPKEVPLNYRLFTIYFILSDYIDRAVKSKIQECL